LTLPEDKVCFIMNLKGAGGDTHGLFWKRAPNLTLRREWFVKENTWKLDIGAEVTAQGSSRSGLAPKSQTMTLRMMSGKRAGAIPLHEEDEGFFSGVVDDVAANDHYLYFLITKPCARTLQSRYQPEGVHGVSQVVDPRLFHGADQGWTGIPLPRICHL